MGKGSGLWLDYHRQFPEILTKFTSAFAARIFIFMAISF
jgi:hypothetical protein